ncbi:MAG: flavin monoamine oxidase family protein [Salinibacterium amurskyense]
MTNIFDTIVVGAGFAGLTAARELSRAGQKVLVLESRDRIGGRTWLAERMGLELELGGTWVHWVQPHVWAEMSRYGIGIVPSPEPQQAYWWNGTQTESCDPDRLLEALDSPNALLTARSREVFPSPYEPLESAHLASLDGVSVADQIDSLELSDPERTLLRSFWTLNFNGKIADAAFTQALRWVALTNGDWKVNFEACATYKVAGGTQALASAIQNDTDATFRYGADVREIVSGPERTSVVISSGEEFSATNVVLAVPIQTLSRIQCTPPLAPAVVRASEEGQVGLGTKIWFTIEGEHPTFVAFGDADWPLNFFQAEYVHDGKTYVIGFGSDAHAIDPDDTSAIESVLARLIPGVRVLESAGHNWVDDEFAQETWPMHKPGFLTESLAALQQPQGRIHIAGADIASGWGGFIDGAIESGLTVTSRILRGSPSPRPAHPQGLRLVEP